MAVKKNTGASAKQGSPKGRSSTKGTAKKESKTKKNSDMEKFKMSAQSKAIFLFAVAAILIFLIFIPGENLWNFIHSFIIGMCGVLAILWPIVLIYAAIVNTMEKKIQKKPVGKVILSILTIFLLSSSVYSFTITQKPASSYFSELGRLYISGTEGNGAGLISGILGIPFVNALGISGAQIITVIALIVAIMFLFGITAFDIYKAFKKPVVAVRDNIVTAREKREARINQQRKQAEANDEFGDGFAYTGKKAKGKSKQAVIDIPLGDNPNKYKNMSKREILESMARITNEPSFDTKDKPDASKIADMISRKKRSYTKREPDQIQPDPQTVPIDAEEKEIAGQVKNAAKNKGFTAKKNEGSSEPSPTSGNTQAGEAVNENGYHYPPVELLHPSLDSNDERAMQELQENGERLINTLESFGVNAKIINICRGPSVTRFELQPAAGVKISKITNLSDDIALNLAANGVRMEAPIPGKAAVGIEVPNKIVSMVSMRELIDSDKFRKSKSKLSVVLGKDISGNIVVTDLGKMPHLLIAGTTGSGKSVCVNSILLSLLYKSSPEEVRLLLIDPKMVEFSKYKGIPHLLIPVVSDAKKAAGALNWAVSEMLQRYKTFSAYNVRDIDSYNKMIDSYNKIRSERPEEEADEPLVNEDNLPIPEEKMSRIVIAIDELADLMMAVPNEVEESICRLAQMARAAGMHLVIATQRPSVNVITGVIKANIPSRISLKVSSQIDSRTILDIGGAEKLIGRGDMLFSPVGAPKPLRVQGCYASDEEIENVTGYIKKSHTSDYNETVVEEIEKIAAEELNKNSKDTSSSKGSSESDDPMMEEAIKLVVEAGQASTSLLQRRLRLGYARAGRLIDEMEQMGIVGPHEGSKSRKVLMSYQQWLERNNLSGE